MVKSFKFDGRVPQWYHIKCFFEKFDLKNLDSIDGFHSLRYVPYLLHVRHTHRVGVRKKGTPVRPIAAAQCTRMRTPTYRQKKYTRYALVRTTAPHTRTRQKKYTRYALVRTTALHNAHTPAHRQNTHATRLYVQQRRKMHAHAHTRTQAKKYTRYALVRTIA